MCLWKSAEKWVCTKPVHTHFLGQHRIILSADTASEKYKLLSKKRR